MMHKLSVQGVYILLCGYAPITLRPFLHNTHLNLQIRVTQWLFLVLSFLGENRTLLSLTRSWFRASWEWLLKQLGVVSNITDV